MSEDDLYFFSQGDYIKYKETKLNERHSNKLNQSGYVQYLHNSLSSSPNKLTTMCSRNASLYIFKITDCQLKYCMSKGIPFNSNLTYAPTHNFIVNGVERQAIHSVAFDNNTGIIDSFNSNPDLGFHLSIDNTYLAVVFGIDVLTTQIQLPITIL